MVGFINLVIADQMGMLKHGSKWFVLNEALHQRGRVQGPDYLAIFQPKL